MPYTRKSTKPAASTTEASKPKVSEADLKPAFHSIGALFETSSDKVPFVGPVDDDVLEAMGLETPDGKEWKLFTSHKTSRSGKEYLSIYLGLSDKR